MKKAAPFLIVLAAALWGTMALFTRTLTALGYTTFDLMLARASMTAIALFAYFIVFDREKMKIHAKDLPLFVITSLVSSILFNVCYVTAINSGSTGIAATLLYTAPIFVIVISAVLFRETITTVKLVALVLAFAGCVLVSGVIGSGEAVSPKALVFGIASGLTYGLYSIFSKIGLQKYSPLTFTAYTFLLSALIVFPFRGVSLVRTTVSLDSGHAWIIFLFAFVTNVIPYTCFTVGLKYVDAGKANITATIEPVVATVLGILVFKERFDFFSALGIFLVLFSAVILNIDLGGKHLQPKGDRNE